MTSPLQRSPSGDVFSGDSPHAGAPGDVFARWNAHTREWEPATIPAGGSGAPLSAVWYVDANTLAPLADQDGSIGLPYADLQDAVTARGTGTYLLVPGGYGDLTVPNNISLSLVGLLASVNSGALAVVGAITAGGNVTLAIRDVESTSISLGESSVLFASGSFNTGDISGGDSVALYGGSTIRNNPLGSVANVSTGSLSAFGTAVNGNVATSGDCVFQNSGFSGSATVNVGGDFYVDLLTLNNFRAEAVVPSVTGTSNVLDAPSLNLTCNVDDVSGAPKITYTVLAFPGARPGDTFVTTPHTLSDALTNVAFGSPVCTVNDQISQPVIILAGAGAVSVDVTVTRFTVGDL